MTRVRNCSRMPSYSARPRISFRWIAFIAPTPALTQVRGEPVGRCEGFDRMKWRAPVLFPDAPGRKRAIGDGGFRLRRLDSPGQLLRVASTHLIVLRLHSPGPVDRRTLLDDLDFRGREQPEQARGRVTDLLRAQVTGGVIGDLAQPPSEVTRERLVLALFVEKLHDIDGSGGDPSRVVGSEQPGPLLTDHVP